MKPFLRDGKIFIFGGLTFDGFYSNALVSFPSDGGGGGKDWENLENLENLEESRGELVPICPPFSLWTFSPLIFLIFLTFLIFWKFEGFRLLLFLFLFCFLFFLNFFWTFQLLKNFPPPLDEAEMKKFQLAIPKRENENFMGNFPIDDSENLFCRVPQCRRGSGRQTSSWAEVLPGENVENLPLCSDVLQVTLFDLDEFFKSENVKYFLTAGTLLGCLRDGGILPWTDDVDLVIENRRDVEKIMKSLENFNFTLKFPGNFQLTSNRGYKMAIDKWDRNVYRICPDYGGHEGVFISQEEGLPLVDVYTGDWWINKEIKLTGGDFEKPGYCRMAGKDFPVPGRPFDVVKKLYGRQFKKAIKRGGGLT